MINLGKENFFRIGDLEIIVVPGQDSKKNPILFSPGWAKNHEETIEVLDIIQKSGRALATVNHARWGGSFEKNKAKKFPKEGLRKANSLLQAAEKLRSSQKNISNSKIDIIAHSEGAIGAVIAANLRPELFEKIVLISPAGLSGDCSFKELRQRYKEDGQSAQKKDLSKKVGWKILAYRFKNPVRSIRELNAISRFQISDLLKEAVNQGIKVIILASEEDQVFPGAKIAQALEKENLLAQDKVNFIPIQGKHRDFYSFPKERMQAALQALE